MANDLVSCLFVFRLRWSSGAWDDTSLSPFQWSASDSETLHHNNRGKAWIGSKYIRGRVLWGSGSFLARSQRKVEKVLLSASPYPFVRLSSGNDWRARERISIIVIFRHPVALVNRLIFWIDIGGATYCCVRRLLACYVVTFYKCYFYDIFLPYTAIIR
jgi:hypothetical protein